MNTTKGMGLKITTHAEKVMAEKNFSLFKVHATFNDPKEIYPSGSHSGQYRITGNGLCLVGIPEGKTFKLITIYADRVITPPREDQLNTPEGRRYADRYRRGLGRG